MRFLPTLLLLTFSAMSQTLHPSMLTSTGWLASHLNDRSIVILHTGTPQDYSAGHIPGSRLVTLPDISITDEQGLRLQLPAVGSLEQAFARLGVTDHSRIIVYAGNESVQSATRVWFTLDYLGLGDRASLLDGGLALWHAEGRELSSGSSAAADGSFTPHPDPSRVATVDWVSGHLHDPGIQLLDARTPEFYTGASAGSMPRAGHIPGARNIPYPTVFDERGRLKPEAELRRMFAAKTTVTYCHIGQQATVLYFVARYLGLDARLYDGSFQEWSRRPELPVEPVAQH